MSDYADEDGHNNEDELDFFFKNPVKNGGGHSPYKEIRQHVNMRESNKSSASVYSRNIFSKVRGTDVKHSNEDDKEDYWNNDFDNGGHQYEREYDDEEEDEDEDDDDDKYGQEIFTDVHLKRAAEIARQKKEADENIKKQFLGINKLDKN
jgi:hypothetical protein